MAEYKLSPKRALQLSPNRLIHSNLNRAGAELGGQVRRMLQHVQNVAACCRMKQRRMLFPKRMRRGVSAATAPTAVQYGSAGSGHITSRSHSDLDKTEFLETGSTVQYYFIFHL